MIRVLLAEDVPMLRGALVALLNLEPDIEVVADVESGDEALAAAKSLEPDVAILDIDLPGKDGLTVARELRAQAAGCRTLILTSLGRPGTVRRALDAKVNGFMLKDAPSDRLADAVREVSVGRRVVDSELALTAWDTELCPLSSREMEVMRIAADGSTVDDIASSLFLSKGTVRNYLTSAVTKLGARNRIDAVRLAKESGWL